MSRGKSVISALTLCGVLLSVSLCAFAQGELRIARPVDGATVRETVNILVPISAVPDGGFISCMVDGKNSCATDCVSQDGRYYVYRWDTKAVEVSPETGEIKGRPKDGKHEIVAQAYGSDGKKHGTPTKVTVYVKNDASADMPAAGLKLRYKEQVGTSHDYRFRLTENIKSIEGATTLAKAIGEDIEGAQGTVRRSVEDKVYGDSVLVRQKLMDTLIMYYGGTAVPQANFNAKSQYHVEDSLGHVTYIMASSSPGIPLTVDMPILPEKPVKIGDKWVEPMKIFKFALTGQSARMNVESTLEGLEWHNGQPCAKIKGKFRGTIKLPYSTLVKEPLMLDGEVTTFFAYRTGQVITSTVRAIAEPQLDPSMVSRWFENLISMKNSLTGGNQALDPNSVVPRSGSGMGGLTEQKQTVKVKVEFVQTLELVR